MEENQKPFACTIEGCEMTFTNEDHLNWHLKKHDMALNLGLANKSADLDQTPTPTRFIRNCEEVGLFQDLQNVNPFDETFKKAIESGKSGTLHVPEGATNDDTLHTPHILPHVECNNVKYGNGSQSSEFCIDDSQSYDLAIVTDEPVKNSDWKHKLKETIKNKIKIATPITPLQINTQKLNTPDVGSPKEASLNTNNQQKDVNDERGAKLREMNRAAQFRCRKRKQIQWKKMQEELSVLKRDNLKVNHENQNFRHKFYAMKELLLKHKTHRKTTDKVILERIEELLHSTNQSVKEAPPEKHEVKKKIAPTVPVRNVGQSAAQKPFVIKVVGSVSQVALNILPNK